MEIVMKVYMGQLSVTQAAKELGVTRAYYYQLEEEMLRASLSAVTPQKPGPKKPLIDAEKAAIEEKLKAVERENELLSIKLRHLEEIQKEMISRGIGVLREKKQSRAGSSRRHGKKVHGTIQTDGALEAGRGSAPGRDDQKHLPGFGAQPGDAVSMEGRRPTEDRAPEAGSGTK
jgi:transposase-like protein